MKDSPCSCVVVAEDYLIVAKEANLPTVPLASRTQEPTLLSRVGAWYPEVLKPMGNLAHEGGVLHRLDTETCGLVLIARNQRSFDALSKAQRALQFTKHYAALVAPASSHEGYPPYDAVDPGEGSIVVSSSFRPFGAGRKAVRPVNDRSPEHVRAKAGTKRYHTTIHGQVAATQGRSVLLCTIVEGFRHQIRCHLAWISHPIIGDRLYGGDPSPSLHLAAIAMEFPHPRTGARVRTQWEGKPDWATPVDPLLFSLW